MANVQMLLQSLMDEIGDTSMDAPTIDNLLSLWIQETQSFLSPKTLDSHKLTINYIKNSSRANTDKLSRESLRTLALDYKKYLDKLKLSPSSINSYLVNLQTFMNWLRDEKYIHDKFKVRKIKVSEKAIRAYSEEQMDLIKDRIIWKRDHLELNQRHRKIYFQCHLRTLYMARYAGLRVGEICNLKLSDIHEKRIWILDLADRIVKGAREEWVPVSDKLMNFMLADKRGINEIWYLDNGFGSPAYHQTSTLTSAFKQHQEAVGISGIKPLHGFRAAFCKKLGNSGTPLPILKDLMRHTDLKTTLRYMDIHQEDQKLKAVQLL